MASVNKWIGIQLYDEGKSIPQVSSETGVPQSTVRYRLLKVGALRSRGDAISLAASQGRWSHGKVVSKFISDAHRENIILSNKTRSRENCSGISIKPNGYAEITMGENKGRGQHVVVMEEMIGRKISPDEVVHHIDHDRKNNDPKNLVLMTRSEHARLHATEIYTTRERYSNGRFC